MKLAVVHTVGLYPQIDGIFEVKRRWTRKFQYKVKYGNEWILLYKREVKIIG